VKPKPYPKYREERMGFVDSLPEHWTSKRLKYLGALNLSNVDKKTVDGQEDVQLCNYVDVYKNERITGDMEFMAATATKQQLKRFGLRRGDVMLTKDSETPDDIAVPAVAAEDLDGVLCGYHLAMLRPSDGNVGRYLSRAIAARGLREQFHVEALGVTRFGLDNNAIGSARLPVPPPDDQQEIAEFLDRETEKIDRLITEKDKLLGLLEDRRKSVISEAVTKGLNPDVKMRDSGVPWIGEIPEHWDLRELKRIARIGNGSTPKRGNIAYWRDGSYPWLNSSVVNQERVTRADQFVTDVALRECHLPKITPPVVLVGITGEGRTRGMATLLTIEATINQHVAYAKPKTAKANAEFLYRSIGSQYEILRRDSSAGGSTKGAITCAQLGRLPIAVPPVGEQEQLIMHIQRSVCATDRAMACLAHGIALLRERRAALVSAAVTGQIDVREEVR
jgi:type I restriction enzyme S subunit